MRTVAPVSPGEMLDEEFLKPLGLTKYRLAKDIGVPPQRIGDIVAGKRWTESHMDGNLNRHCFSVSKGWMNPVIKMSGSGTSAASGVSQNKFHW